MHTSTLKLVPMHNELLYVGGTQNFPELLKKLFKIFVQV